MTWAREEFRTARPGDKRLNDRLVKLAEKLAAKPTASIPAACGGWGDTAAAYRMLDNERCDWREVIEAHGRCAVRRMAGLPVVLCLNDTTELDFNGQTIQGLGPLSYEAQRGMYLHPTYAVSTQREPLGVLDAWMWAREPRDTRGQRGGLCESTRWIESYERLAERAGELPETRLVQVGDRESDILALMQRAQGLGWPVDLLVRSQHNRRLPSGARLWDEVQASEPLGEIEFTLGARAGRSARRVRQELRIKRVTVDHDVTGAIEMSCVMASEVGAPAGDKPVCWRLLTNRPAHTLEQARELIEWYRARWEIEMFFHVLKTGCRVQALQLASLPRIERALALSMVVSWRIFAFRGSSGAAASASPCAGAPRGAGISGKKRGPETIRALQFGGGRTPVQFRLRHLNSNAAGVSGNGRIKVPLPAPCAQGCLAASATARWGACRPPPTCGQWTCWC